MLRIVGGLILAALLLVAGLAVFVLDTTVGARWLAGVAAQATGGAVQITGIEGSVARGLRADTLLIAAGTTRVHAEAVRFDLQPVQLLRARVVVANLRAARLTVDAAPGAGAQPEPFRMPVIALPLRLQIDALDIGAIEWRGESPAVLTGVHFAGGLSGSSLTVGELRGALGGFALRLAGTAELVPELPVDARVEWRVAGTPFSGAGTFRGDITALAIEQALRVPESVRLSATLRDPAGEPRIEARVTWEAVALELPAIGRLSAREGALTLEGGFERWSATATARLAGASLPPLQVRAKAVGSPQRIVLEEARLSGSAGTLSATGELALGEPRRLQLALTATDVDTAALRPGLTGRLSAQATLEAELPGEVRLQVAELHGRLMDRPLTGAGQIGYRAGLLSFDGVRLRSGANLLRADGTLGERLSGRFALDAPELSTLWPDLAGRVSAQASLAGTPARPVVELDARGEALVAGDAGVERFNLILRTDPQQRVDARFTAEAIDIGERRLGDLEAGLQGSLTDHRLDARLGNGTLAASLQSEGGWDGTTLVHEVSAASVVVDEVGEWRLSGAPRVALRAGAAEVGAHCWRQAPASLCIETLAWSAERARLSAQLRDLDLGRFAPWLPQAFVLSGRANADADLKMEAGVLTGTASWEQADTRLTFTGGDDDLAVAFEAARVSLGFTPVAASATLTLVTEAGTRLEGNARMGAPPGPAAPLEARFTGRLPDVAPLVPLVAGDLDLAEVAGEIGLDVRVEGSLGAPRITGSAQLTGGAVVLTDLGVRLEKIDIAVIGDGSPVLQLQGTAHAGGPLNLDGELRPLEAGGPAGVVRIRGERLDAVRLPDRYVQASPDLSLSFSQGAARVDGEVLIPRADVVVRELPESAIVPSADTVVVGREEAATDAGMKAIGGEIVVSFGSDVRVRGFGLDTRLAGRLELSQSATGEPQAFGVVRLVEGKIGAYGKELTIERGTLGFAGPLDDPVVDLRATRQVDWEGRRVTAGVLVRGPATRTESRVFSEPAMSEADALSFLVSGRPLQSADSDERSAVAGAALALGLQRTSPLTDRVGSAVTLDELGLQGGETDEAEVVAGKQLNSDLYVRFTYGLFNRIGTVLARYRLSRNLSIEAASGEDQSLDLVWSIERD